MRHSSSVPKIVQVNFIKDLEKYQMMTPEFQKNFIVEPTKIVANCECFINLDLNDYDERLIVESTGYYLLPGILTVTSTDDNTKNWTFPFDFQVKLIKPAELQEHGKTLIFNYTPGETIITQESYQETKDVSVLERLLEAQAKYITSPELLVYALITYLGGLDLNIIETIVQNMFRDGKDPMIPARLTDYTNYKIYSQKKLPFVTSWISALTFENIYSPSKVVKLVEKHYPH